MDEMEPMAPKEWRGRYFEDMEVGDVYRSRLGRTIDQVDNTWFTLLTGNTNQVHFNAEFAAKTEFKEPLVNSCLTLSIVVGLSVADTSENAMANLAWDSISMPTPVFAGDTLWSESEVIGKRESQSRPHQGIVSIRTRGINQRGETVVQYLRTFMMYRRTAPQAASVFPDPVSDWAV
ncbi:MaoC family dehydratase [Microbacterium suwonense]|uniref:Molybdenum cofactor biosynthesis protein MoeC n=1 Tax=Microbacterium suwonense TaxID=683047 RepID=A0ABN6X3K3_9MICO|nr:MaoC family dehydratase [Microbacterium suwonense]BDZ39306.1 molybdenum cofactor biosynthesis protein MoeC [Microbacterium suwonense]